MRARKEKSMTEKERRELNDEPIENIVPIIKKENENDGGEVIGKTLTEPANDEEDKIVDIKPIEPGKETMKEAVKETAKEPEKDTAKESEKETADEAGKESAEKKSEVKLSKEEKKAKKAADKLAQKEAAAKEKEKNLRQKEARREERKRYKYMTPEEQREYRQRNRERDRKEFWSDMRRGILQLLIYFGIFVLSIVFWELVLRLQMGAGISKGNLYFLLFVPAQALILAAINGFVPKQVSRFLFPITMLIVAVFYGIQMVYFRIFGSLLSVSMLGMGGDAVGNFWWAMQETVIKSIGLIILLLCPAIAALVLGLTKKIKVNPYPVLIHIMAFLIAIGFWFGAAEGLRFGGTGRQSAYYAYHSNISDTDTTASRLGAMTTSIIEAGSYYFGFGKKEEMSTLVKADTSALELTSQPDPDEEIPSELPKEEEPAYEVKPHVFETIDFEELAENANDNSIRDMYEYFGDRKPTNTNQYTGLLEGYNVIYICGEGFWTYGVHEKVTPTLYKMMNNGIILNNYYNSFRNTTTNGEYAFATSYWPDVSRQADSGRDVGSMPQSSSKYMPTGLGHVFSKAGMKTFAFHNYYGTYYRRKFSWPNLGLENLYFMNEGMSFSTSWPASDNEMMQQSLEKYIGEDRFFAYYMTFSGHGPYNANNVMYRKNIEEVKNRLGEDANKYNSEALGYLAGELELEYGMEYLVNTLEEAGLMDKTLIVLTGDHYPYYLSEQGRTSLVGRPISEMDIYHSTCIMYTTGLEENISTNTYCCNVDILPTVLNLLGIDYDSRLYMGTDIFSDGIHKAVLYDKSFITEKVTYNAKTGQVDWKLNPEKYDVVDLQAYLDNMSALIDSEYSASVNIIKTNFFLHLWQDARLMLPEEVSQEMIRENTVRDQMNILNEEEAKRLEEYLAKKAAEEAAKQEQQQQENP